MEEDKDIKFLEEIVEKAKKENDYDDNRYFKAIDNIIARYKELEEDKEKYKKLANENLRNEIIFREKECPEDVYIRQEMYIPKSKVKER